MNIDVVRKSYQMELSVIRLRHDKHRERYSPLIVDNAIRSFTPSILRGPGLVHREYDGAAGLRLFALLGVLHKLFLEESVSKQLGALSREDEFTRKGSAQIVTELYANYFSCPFIAVGLQRADSGCLHATHKFQHFANAGVLQELLNLLENFFI